ncbi:hypothetical protein GGI35DRAFT_181043 [Trichoderma velutinum]
MRLTSMQALTKIILTSPSLTSALNHSSALQNPCNNPDQIYLFLQLASIKTSIRIRHLVHPLARPNLQIAFATSKPTLPQQKGVAAFVIASRGVLRSLVWQVSHPA